MRKTSSLDKPWKNIKLIKKVFDLFGHKNIFFVGGAVRNSLLNQSLEDIDLAVKLNVDTVKKKLLKAKINFVDFSKGHGTLSLLSQGNKIEITSMRIDKETFGRKAKVEFVDDIYLDSCRRDFTINSIYSNFHGKIYDPHNGIKDLKNRKVRFIGNPIERIKEDKLRILRYYRFLAYYGCNSNVVDKDSMIASRKSSSLISNISKERKSYEFFKLLTGKHAAEVLILMKKQKILKTLVPGFEIIQNPDIKLLNDLKAEKLIRISFLLIMSKFELNKLRKYLFFSKREYEHLKLICTNFKVFEINNIKDARLAKYKLGYDISINIYYLKCFFKKKNMKNRIKNVLEYWNVPSFPINGNDLKKIGIAKGITLGNILKNTIAWWVSQDFKPDKKQCLKKSKLFISNSTRL